MKRVIPIISMLVLICTGVILCMYVLSLLKTPMTDRDWMEEFEKTASTRTTEHGTTVLSNVRDWTYKDAQILSKDWTELEVDPNTIERVWFLSEPFSTWKAVGHTFLSFEFSDKTVLSFSIEARSENDEEYSAIGGVFNEYELAYVWGTERDLVTRRLLYLEHPLRRYPLDVSPEMAQTLFLKMAEDTNSLTEQPRFYNTLTENCTNTLAEIVNSIKPHTLPYNIAWNLTGYADLYLMDEGFIPLDEKSKEITRTKYDLTAHKLDIEAIATSSPKDFSATLNAMAGE